MDRQIRSIKREEDKIKKSLKEAAAKNDKQICTILAKEIVRSRKAVNKLYTSKAQLSSVQMQMQQQLGEFLQRFLYRNPKFIVFKILATLKVAGSLAKSTEVMQAMQNLVKLPQISATMREMSMEMTKAGILEEMIDETMESIEDVEEIEEEAQSEIDKVLWEITAGKLGEAPSVPESSMQQPAAAEPEEEDDMTEMQSRLEALRS